MAIPSFHFDVEEHDGLFRAVCTEFEGIEATADGYAEAVQALLAKLTERVMERTKEGESLPTSIYEHRRPL